MLIALEVLLLNVCDCFILGGVSVKQGRYFFNTTNINFWISDLIYVDYKSSFIYSIYFQYLCLQYFNHFHLLLSLGVLSSIMFFYSIHDSKLDLNWDLISELKAWSECMFDSYFTQYAIKNFLVNTNLNITVTDNLSWKSHIQNITKTVSSSHKRFGSCLNESIWLFNEDSLIYILQLFSPHACHHLTLLLQQPLLFSIRKLYATFITAHSRNLHLLSGPTLTTILSSSSSEPQPITMLSFQQGKHYQPYLFY